MKKPSRLDQVWTAGPLKSLSVKKLGLDLAFDRGPRDGDCRRRARRSSDTPSGNGARRASNGVDAIVRVQLRAAAAHDLGGRGVRADNCDRRSALWLRAAATPLFFRTRCPRHRRGESTRGPRAIVCALRRNGSVVEGADPSINRSTRRAASRKAASATLPSR